MIEQRLEARLTDWYARAGAAAAPEPLRVAVLGIPDLSDGASAEARLGSRTRRTRRMSAGMKFAVAAAAVMVVAVAGLYLLPGSGGSGGGGATVSPRSSASPSLSPAPQPSPSPQAAATRRARSLGDGKWAIDPGPYDLLWPIDPSGARIAVTMPTGWWMAGDDPAVADYTAVYTGGGRVYQPTLGLAAHAVSRVVASVCASASSSEVGPTSIEVGPTVDDLTKAIGNVVGTHWSNPADVMVGGYPAKQLVSTFSAADCLGPARRWMWLSDSGAFFVEDGVTSTIYVVDVDGDRLVLTSDDRDAARDDVAQLEAIMASIRIERHVAAGGTPRPSSTPTPPGSFPVSMGPDADLRIGRHEAIVDGVPFSFEVPTARWEPQRPFYISKSFEGPQDAEAILRWTTFPNSLHVDPCRSLLNPPGPSAAGLAAVVATAPGTELVGGPSDVTVGGRTAKHVVLTVRDDVGCQPGFFYTYDPNGGGAFWRNTQPGDTITVWIVDLDGTLFFIEGEAREDASSALDQIQQIVDSIRFE